MCAFCTSSSTCSRGTPGTLMVSSASMPKPVGIWPMPTLPVTVVSAGSATPGRPRTSARPGSRPSSQRRTAVPGWCRAMHHQLARGRQLDVQHVVGRDGTAFTAAGGVAWAVYRTFSMDIGMLPGQWVGTAMEPTLPSFCVRWVAVRTKNLIDRPVGLDRPLAVGVNMMVSQRSGEASPSASPISSRSWSHSSRGRGGSSSRTTKNNSICSPRPTWATARCSTKPCGHDRACHRVHVRLQFRRGDQQDAGQRPAHRPERAIITSTQTRGKDGRVDVRPDPGQRGAAHQYAARKASR